MTRKISRKEFLRLASVGAAGALLAACGGAPSQPAAENTAAPAEPTAAAGAEPTAATGAGAEPTAAGEAAAEPTATAAAEAGAAVATPTREVPRGTAAEVAREKSLILMWGLGLPGIGNPYAAGFNHQMGMMALHEPLFFYSAFGKGEIPWLAESYEYNADFSEVVIKIRPGSEWSDGTPFTAKDPAFTLNMLRDEKNSALSYAKDMNKWVKDAVATDDTTLTISFTQTAPRFVYDFLMNKFDLGVLIVPEHIFKDQTDIAGFLFYDPAQGWPLSTGPYKIADWTAQQMLLDLRPEWWAAKTGFAELPKVERIVAVLWPDATVGAQAMINNEIDSSLDLRPPVMKTVIDSNEKVITHTLREPPYGYTDWWPNSLWFNTLEKPFDDPEVRKAINHAIDREQIVQIGYEGAGVATDLPFPEFPSLKQYFDAAQPVLAKYPTSDYNLAMTDEIMMAKGYTRDGENLWVDASGNRIEMTIYGFDIFGDYGPVLAEQLRAGGFDASFQAPPDAYTKMDDGTGKTFLFGHGGAIADVYPTMDLFHGRNSRPTGETGGITTRWKNEEYDKLVDELALMPVGDPKGVDLYVKALEIYLREKPELPIVQWLHRIPYNTTYWTNWPTAENPYVNGAFWHKTFPLMLHQLQPVSG